MHLQSAVRVLAETRLWLLLVTLGAPALAQPTLRLHAEPAGEFPAEFTRLRSVRELSDGRILVTDSWEKSLLILDWDRRELRSIGRVGDGPGEFRSLDILVALPADTTIVVDPTARRLLILLGDRYLGSVPVEQALHLFQFFSPLFGADTRDGVLALAAIPDTSDRLRSTLTRQPSWADSLHVVRLHRTTRTIDTLTALRGRVWSYQEFSRGNITYTVRNPLSVAEQAWLFPDGYVALLRKEPYRVEWRSPGGAVRLGPVLETRPVVVTAADRQFAIDQVLTHIPPPRPRESEFNVNGWPRLMPAFTAEALHPLPDGKIAVERLVTHGSRGPRFDIVDRAGERVATLELAVGERILGFGRTAVYVVRRDDDDLEYLSRRAWRVP